MSWFIVNVVLTVLICLPVLGMAAVQDKYILVIKNHKYVPAQLTIPANQRIMLTVENQDPTVEEFESYDLNREKVVQGNDGKIKVFIGPLIPGKYKFFGDYHQSTAQGVIIVK